jgi:hypothetical protein
MCFDENLNWKNCEVKNYLFLSVVCDYPKNLVGVTPLVQKIQPKKMTKIGPIIQRQPLFFLLR